LKHCPLSCFWVREEGRKEGRKEFLDGYIENNIKKKFFDLTIFRSFEGGCGLKRDSRGEEECFFL
jgi:hypothetical protein